MIPTEHQGGEQHGDTVPIERPEVAQRNATEQQLHSLPEGKPVEHPPNGWRVNGNRAQHNVASSW